ncbi:MAG: GyrI-like domain-containing protein [Saprospiraceae bacterium]|nr:GyrI-like domain-containing protein [Saprospiraceae bacterium]
MKKSNSGSFNINTAHKPTRDFSLTSELKNIKPFTVLSNQVRGIVGDKKTYDGWADLLSFAYQLKIINTQTKSIAVHWDDPTITQESNIRYDACVTISTTINDTNKFSIKQFSGGKYLCVLYKGDYKYLPDVYNQIFRDFIFKQNYRLREEPIFEEFLNSINDTNKNNLLTLIHIPIE